MSNERKRLRNLFLITMAQFAVFLMTFYFIAVDKLYPYQQAVAFVVYLISVIYLVLFCIANYAYADD